MHQFWKITFSLTFDFHQQRCFWSSFEFFVRNDHNTRIVFVRKFINNRRFWFYQQIQHLSTSTQQRFSNIFDFKTSNTFRKRKLCNWKNEASASRTTNFFFSNIYFQRINVVFIFFFCFLYIFSNVVCFSLFVIHRCCENIVVKNIHFVKKK